MSSARPQSPAVGWLAENGPRELELLLRAIIFHPFAPILVTDNNGTAREASVGAGKLLGLPRDKIIGRPIDDFAQPACKPQISHLWKALQEHGEEAGTLRLVGPDDRPRDVEYKGKGNVLPVRHLLILHDKTAPAGSQPPSAYLTAAWFQDYALSLIDTAGHIAAWYSGAERIYSYPDSEILGQPISLPPEQCLSLIKSIPVLG